MIDFALSHEEQIARDTARDFAERRLRPEVRRHEHDGVSPELVREMRALGLLGGEVQVAPLLHAVVLEELAAVDAAATLGLDLAGLTRAIAGEDPSRLALVVDPDGAISFDGDTQRKDSVSGDAPFCIGRSPEKALVVWSDRAAFVHEIARAETANALALHAAGTCALAFDRAPAVEIAMNDELLLALARMHVGQAAILVGLARAAWEYASRYAQDRVAFGRPVAHHQAIAFMLVEMAMAADVARLATWRAAIDPTPWTARAALDEAAEAALAATERAVQILGGHGYLKDHPVEKWMREARALTLAWCA